MIVPIGISESVQVYLRVPIAISTGLDFMLLSGTQCENETCFMTDRDQDSEKQYRAVARCRAPVSRRGDAQSPQVSKGPRMNFASQRSDSPTIPVPEF